MAANKYGMNAGEPQYARFHQRDHDHEFATEKPMEKKDREKNVRTRVPPERLHTRNEKDAPQDKCGHSHDGERQ